MRGRLLETFSETRGIMSRHTFCDDNCVVEFRLTSVGLCESASGLKLGANVGANEGAKVGFCFNDISNDSQVSIKSASMYHHFNSQMAQLLKQKLTGTNQ